jgi:hypothetical protein
MNTKLTIRLNNHVIEKAKNYAHNQKISLSKIIESYLDSITQKKTDDFELTPLVKRLSGVIDLPKDYDYKNDHSDYLPEKQN